MDYSNLLNISFSKLHAAFLDAFSNYEIPFELSQAELQYMLERRGYLPALSSGAFLEDELIGFIFNGRGLWQGKPTAYDTGTGIIQAFQGKGIGKQLFNFTLTILKNAGIQQYLLEVLQKNTAAVKLYRNNGFETTRAFDCYFFNKNILITKGKKIPVSFKATTLTTIQQLQNHWDIEPSWQNSLDSISRKLDCFKLVEAHLENKLAGYGIIEPHTGDIPQLFVRPEFRRKGVGKALLSQLLTLAETTKVKVINIDKSYNPASAFFESCGIPIGTTQFEMILPL